MKRFHYSIIGSSIIFPLIAGLIVLGGCTADTLTGPTPEDEQVTVQQATQSQSSAQSADGNGDNDDKGRHGNESGED